MHTHITSPSTSSTTPTPPRTPRSAAEDADYHAFVKGVQASYDHIVKSGEPVFTTNASKLFDLFLGGLPADRRGHYNCQACRYFFRRFGGLVTITETGALRPIMWSRSSDTFEWPLFFRKAVLALHDTVTNAMVTGVYLVTKNEWGISYTEDEKAPEGRWTHLHVLPRRRSRPVKRLEAKARKDAGWDCTAQLDERSPGMHWECNDVSALTCSK